MTTREFEMMFRNAFLGWSEYSKVNNNSVRVPMNIYTTSDGLYVEIALVGDVDKEKIIVNVDSDKLNLKYEHPKEESNDEKTYFVNKINRSNFNYEIKLDSKCDHNKTVAEYKNGLLSVYVPFATNWSPKKVEIQ